MLGDGEPNQLTMGEVKDVSMEMVFCAIQGQYYNIVWPAYPE